MALKRKITKAEFDGLADAIKAEYKAEGDGYALDVSGYETEDALRRAKDHEVSNHAATKTKLAEAHERLESLTGDAKNIEATYRTKEAELTRGHKAAMKKEHDFTDKLLIDAQANGLATKISTAPKLLLPVIRDRFTVDRSGDEPVVRIKNAEGKADEKFTIADLEKEIVANKDFSAILTASKASGGGAPRSPLPGGGAPTNPNQNQPVALSAMKPQDLAATIKAKKDAGAQT